ncbi:MAG: hypothetical protein ABIG11_02025 [bacterium]
MLKKNFPVFALAAIVTAFSVVCIAAAEFRTSDSKLAVDFPAGWVRDAQVDDPDIVLRLEKGKEATFEFTQLNCDLGDFYLKARVKEQMDPLRAKGISISGETQKASIHGAAMLYYMSYYDAGKTQRIGFLTYAGSSFAISSSGVQPGEFAEIISSIRSSGEKIAVRKKPTKPNGTKPLLRRKFLRSGPQSRMRKLQAPGKPGPQFHPFLLRVRLLPLPPGRRRSGPPRRKLRNSRSRDPGSRRMSPGIPSPPPSGL